MKKLTLLPLIALLFGCSSFNYIYPNQYSEPLKNKCIENLTEVTKKGEKDCAFKAASGVHLAYRMYEIRAEVDLDECKAENQSKEAINLCFENKQKQHYEEYFSSHYLNK